MFKPQLTYRLRRNNGTDTPLPPEEPAGQNPPNGAMIDYWLKDCGSGDSGKGTASAVPIAAAGKEGLSPCGPLTLEITDDHGNVVRRLSSADKPEPINPKDFNVPMYWVRPSRAVSAAPGMHRFVWDLTYPVPDLLSRDFPISAIPHDTPLYPEGATVLPGKYTVTLSDGGKIVAKEPLEVRMDPRVKTSPEDLRRQFDLDRKIAGALHRDYEALQQVRSLRSRLKALTAQNPQAQLLQSIMDLETKAAAIEGSEGGYGTRYLTTPEGRSLARLNGALGAILEQLDTADAAPTTKELEMFGEVEKALEEQLAAWNQIKAKDIPELNEQLRKAGLPPIDLQKPVPSTADSAQTTTRDKDRDME